MHFFILSLPPNKRQDMIPITVIVSVN